ncbi:MAG: hypothetical protein FD121_1294 [Gallionellaceae bacterium]|nr:MAG: hypothetical protein FD121_1294 [Gallionellaceae bacterium]
MSSEQGPRLRGCERPRVLPSLRYAVRKNKIQLKEEARV